MKHIISLLITLFLIAAVLAACSKSFNESSAVEFQESGRNAEPAAESLTEPASIVDDASPPSKPEPPLDPNTVESIPANDYETPNDMTLSAPEKTPTWQNLYRDFIENMDYLTMGSETWIDTEDKNNAKHYYDVRMFALHDMDADGIPELIVEKNNIHYGTSDVYRIQDNRIIFAGTVADLSSMSFSNDPAFPGLFDSDGGSGSFYVAYFWPENGVIAYENISTTEIRWNEDGEEISNVETIETSDNALYEASKNTTQLKAYTGREEILAVLVLE